MKDFSVGFLAIVVSVFGAVLVSASPLGESHLIGAKKCTWGPSYWCSNLTNAKGCNAVRHCIQTVWETHKVPVDNDSICKICKDMVTQARDQLRSNETMEELKEVFDGSCNLIPIKLVKKECCRLADDFIPELVEALSSQMNPDQVCSVAGLCNNAEIDKQLTAYYAAALEGTLQSEEESHEAPAAVPKQEAPAVVVSEKQQRQLSCGNCNNVAQLITDKFNAANRDDVLENILRLCGEMSSFSDACSNIVLIYFNDIYKHLKEEVNAAGICHVSGACVAKYHQHPEDVETQKMNTDAAPNGDDDIPCELCEQLIHHLRDVLIANTTEAEFKLVLEGLCKQTAGFEKECLSIVDQYYDVIYHTLLNNLDANGACFMIGVCPKGSNQAQATGEIRPLLPVLPPADVKITMRKKLGQNEPKFTQAELQSMVLPIDKLMGAQNPDLLVENGQLCTLCEYVLHFIQETLATSKTEDDIKRTVNGICNKMPSSLRGECHNFIDMYGDAVIALLIQDLDPRAICPMLQFCPKNHDNHLDVEIFAPQVELEKDVDVSDKPTCPLCLFAVAQAQEKIKTDKSKTNIKNVLNQLCVHFPEKLKVECMDFVQTYSNELIDMLISDFKAQEICVALKLCPKQDSSLSDLGISIDEEADCSSEEDCESNELDNNNEKPVEISFDKDDAVAPNCWLCEEFIKNAEKKVGKHTTKADVKKALARSCDKLRKKIQPRCHDYVDKYGDKIATLVLKEMEPKIICRELGLCLWSEQEDLEIDEALKYDVIALPNEEVKIMQSDDIIIQDPPTCVLCEFVMAKLDAELTNKTTQEEIKHAIETVCKHMPKTVSRSCNKFIDQYANAIIALIGSVPPKEICQKLQLCVSARNDFNDEVVECGVCHGATASLLSYLKAHPNDVNNSKNNLIAIGCEVLPAKYYRICAQMVGIYGRSILNVAAMEDVSQAHICAKIGKCFDNESSSSAFARLSD